MRQQAARLVDGDPWRVWSVWAPLGLAFWFWWSQALFGFVATDDTANLAQPWRILHGETPHADFTSRRVAGAALLHLPEAMLPAGMLAVGRLVVVLQLLWIAVATVQMCARGWRVSRLQEFALVGIAFLVNAGVWPITQFRVIDGIFVGVTALWLVGRQAGSPGGMRAQWVAMWLLAGLAPLMKQGFALVPVLVAALVVVHRRSQAWRYAPLVAVPPLLYLLWSGPSAIGQLYAGSSGELLVPVQAALATVQGPAGLLTLVLVGLACVLVLAGPGSGQVNAVLAGLLVSAPILWTAYQERGIGLAGSWAYLSAIVLAAVAVVTVRDLGRASVVVALLLMGFAASMSWNAPAPSLLGGTLLAASLLLLAGAASPAAEPLGRTRGLTVLAGAVLAASLAVSTAARAGATYLDSPRAELTQAVDHPQFALVRMSAQSAAYVDALRSCLHRYPASRVAVLPDNPGLYPLLGLRNPFDMDWWLPQERTEDQAARIDATVAELNREDDWLVLFQSYPLMFTLPSLTVDQVNSPGSPFAYEPSDTRILDDLTGTPVQCGSLTGKYRTTDAPRG